jgi:hypothetical protein
VSGHIDDSDPLGAYGTGARDAIRRLVTYETAGDLVLLGAIDPVTGEVTGFEELIGSHGGLGGWQTEPFILVPAGLAPPVGPHVGAPTLYHQHVAWQRDAASEAAASEAEVSEGSPAG